MVLVGCNVIPLLTKLHSWFSLFSHFIYFIIHSFIFYEITCAKNIYTSVVNKFFFFLLYFYANYFRGTLTCVPLWVCYPSSTHWNIIAIQCQRQKKNNCGKKSKIWKYLQLHKNFGKNHANIISIIIINNQSSQCFELWTEYKGSLNVIGVNCLKMSSLMCTHNYLSSVSASLQF